MEMSVCYAKTQTQAPTENCQKKVVKWTELQ